MRDALRSSLILAGLVGCAFLAHRLFSAAPAPTQTFVAYATEHHWLTHELDVSLQRSMRAALVNTAFQDRWQINQSPAADRINVYLIRIPDKQSRLPDFMAKYRNSASYVGELNTIVLDIAKLDQLTTDLGLASDQGASENPFAFAARHQRDVTEARALLTFWIIGHELGHVMHHDKASHFSSDADGYRRQPVGLPEGVDAYPLYSDGGLQREYDADSFFAQQVSLALHRQLVTRQEIDQFAGQLVQVLENGYVSTVGYGAKPVAGPLAFLSDPNQRADLPIRDHPEFFLRAARLLTLLDHPDRELFADRVPRFERNLVKPSCLTPGLLTIRGAPNADIRFSSDQITLQRSPLRLWLPPGSYRLQIQEEGFLSQSKTVVVRAHQSTQLTYQLDRDPGYHLSATRQLSDAITRAGRSVDTAIYYEWREPVEGAPGWELDRASQAAPSWSRPLLLKAEIQLSHNRCEAAKGEWQSALKLLPLEPPEIKSRSAYALLELADIEEPLAKDPGNPDLIRRYVEQLWALDWRDRATALIRSLPERLQRDPVLQLIAALLERDRGHTKEALSLINRLLKTQSAEQIVVGGYALREWRALVLEDLGQIRSAASDLEATPKGYRDEALHAEFYERHNQIDRAIEVREDMLPDSDPDEACELVRLLLSRGKRSQALSLVDTRKLGDVTYCKVVLGEDALRRHKPSEAATFCNLADPTGAGNDPSDVQRSTACYARALGAQEISAAQQAYRKALWFDPLNQRLRRELAQIESSLGQSSLAECDRWMAQQPLPPH